MKRATCSSDVKWYWHMLQLHHHMMHCTALIIQTLVLNSHFTHRIQCPSNQNSVIDTAVEFCKNSCITSIKFIPGLYLLGRYLFNNLLAKIANKFPVQNGRFKITPLSANLHDRFQHKQNTGIVFKWTV